MCSMDDEVELFECQIAEELMTIGWIHTHPQFVSQVLAAQSSSLRLYLTLIIKPFVCSFVVGFVLIVSRSA